MATVLGTRMQQPARGQEKGEFVDLTFYTLASTASGTIINLCPIAAGTTVVGVTLVNAALGGSTTVSVGDTANSSTYYHSSVSTSSATRTTTTGLPVTYAADDTLFATLSGATGTGVVGIIVAMTRESVVLA